MENILIRTATPEDAAALLAIYTPYIRHTAITFECTVPRTDEFRQRIETTLRRYPWLVAEVDHVPLGYTYASSFGSRAAYRYSVETAIYVDQAWNRSGLGRRLYDALELALSRQNIMNLNACIAVPEKDDEYLSRNSEQFHRHLGYRTVGEFYRCGYKFNRWYNMVWMEKHIGDHPQNPPEIRPFPEIRSLLPFD